MGGTARAHDSGESYSRSLWWQTSAEPAIAPTPFPVGGGVDVAVIGAGYTGLAAALAIAERGKTVVVLDARHVGYGASGRNGGQVIPGLKYDPSALLAKFGPERGAALIGFVGGAADRVFDLVARHDIQCDPKRAGWIQCAHSTLALGAVTARARDWQTHGVAVEILDWEATAARTGTTAYFGGWRDPRAGSVQPLAYARGLARAALSAGAGICEETPVTALERKQERWLVTTPAGTLSARRVILATNGYSSGIVPDLPQTLLPVQSAQVATEPLPPGLGERVMPGGVVLSETRKLAFYMRQSPDGRLVFGGRGSTGKAESQGLMRALEAGMGRLFPEIAGLRIDHRWSGHFALTMDGLPHLHEPQPGLHVLVGCNGRGIALTTAFGAVLAEWAIEGREPIYPVSPVLPLAWHWLRRPVMELGIRWYWLRDRFGFAA